MLFRTDQWTRIVPTSPLVRQAGLEHVRALCDLSSAPWPNGFMVLRPIAANGLFHRFSSSPCCCPAGTPCLRLGDRFPGTRNLRREAIARFDSLPHHAQLFLHFLVVHVTAVIMTDLRETEP